jgi:hypothetical protein
MKVSSDTKVRDATWAVAYGLAIWGLTGENEAPPKQTSVAFEQVREQLMNFFKQFMP